MECCGDYGITSGCTPTRGRMMQYRNFVQPLKFKLLVTFCALMPTGG